MKENLWKFFKENSIPISIGVIGGMSSIITSFFPNFVESNISAKWLILYIYISIVSHILLVKFAYMIYEKLENKSDNINKIKIVKFIQKNKIFLIKKVDSIGNDALVSFYFIDDDNYEIFMGLGNVINIQDKLIQIQLIDFSKNFSVDYKDINDNLNKNDKKTINNILIKSYIPYSYLIGLTGEINGQKTN